MHQNIIRHIYQTIYNDTIYTATRTRIPVNLNNGKFSIPKRGRAASKAGQTQRDVAFSARTCGRKFSDFCDVACAGAVSRARGHNCPSEGFFLPGKTISYARRG